MQLPAPVKNQNIASTRRSPATPLSPPACPLEGTTILILSVINSWPLMSVTLSNRV